MAGVVGRTRSQSRRLNSTFKANPNLLSPKKYSSGVVMWGVAERLHISTRSTYTRSTGSVVIRRVDVASDSSRVR
jgi:hypothetical protein